MSKERIDKLLVDLGIADSVVKAQALVMAGVVLADERRVDKPSESFAAATNIRIKGSENELKFVGRGGIKLEHALETFAVSPSGQICLDIGASTGGFTDCLLQHGAERVVAVDVGTNQLVWSLRNDARVDSRENTNARNLKPSDFDTRFGLAVMDVSFISATKIIAGVLPLLTDDGKFIVLIKPQFEVEKGEVGQGGIVRDADMQDRVVSEVNSFAESVGFTVKGLTESPILGAEGNREFLAFYARQN